MSPTSRRQSTRPSRANRAARETADPNTFASRYPHIARWVEHGWIEIGWPGYYITAFVRACDEGGTAWKGAATYRSLDEALAALDAGLATYMAEGGI